MIKELYSLYHRGAELPQDVRDFISKWHYSKSYRSLQQKHVFELRDNRDDSLVGVAIYGNPMSRHYNKESTIELRRLCLIDDTPRNTESFFISRTLKYLERFTDYKEVVSFADPNHGHAGTIYKASNFRYDGRELNGNPRVVEYEGKIIHLRQMYQKKEGDYSEDAKRIQAAVASGDAQVLKQEQKHRYIYNLER